MLKFGFWVLGFEGFGFRVWGLVKGFGGLEGFGRCLWAWEALRLGVVASGFELN